MNLEPIWKAEFHEFNGFDRASFCAADSDDDNEKSLKSKNSEFLDRILENTLTFSSTACCGEGLSRHIFHLSRMECCEDGTSRPFGSC